MPCSFGLRAGVKKQETCWETYLENTVAELMELCTDLSNQARISGRCLECLTVTGNAKLQISAFLKDSTSDCCNLKLAWVGKGGQDYVFWGVLNQVGLNSRNLPLF